MQTGVFAFDVINVDSYFLGQVQGLAVGGFEVFEIGPEDIVGLAGRDALGKFSHVVGKDLPLGFLILGAPDLHFDAKYRVIVGTPDGPENEGIRFWRFGVLRSRTQEARA
jgi:hypothetical protein